MRSFIFLLVSAVFSTSAMAQRSPPDLPQEPGPRATSAETTDDAVGYAALLPFAEGNGPTVGIAAMHPSLPKGSFVEVTALDTGRTVALVVVGPFNGRGVVGLSPQAAEALNIADGAAVRVRAVTPSPWEQATLRAGRASGSRLDAPPTLLVALRKRLPGSAPEPQRVAAIAADKPLASNKKPVRNVPIAKVSAPDVARETPNPAKPVVVAPPKPPSPKPPSSKPVAAKPAQTPHVPIHGGYGVQVAALSSQDHAAALAKTLGGHIVATGKLYRVQLGPFADAASAARWRDAAARRGYRDAQVFHSE